MLQDLKIYKTNLNDFFKTLEKSYVEYINCDIDSKPEFDKELLPFEFCYCNSIVMITSEGNFNIRTTTSGEGLSTFWIDCLEDNNKLDNHIKIDSRLKAFDVKNGYDDLPFKLVLEFENIKIVLYAAEIYRTLNQTNDYKINDEMILLFDSDKHIEAFEKFVM